MGLSGLGNAVSSPVLLLSVLLSMLLLTAAFGTSQSHHNTCLSRVSCCVCFLFDRCMLTDLSWRRSGCTICWAWTTAVLSGWVFIPWGSKIPSSMGCMSTCEHICEQLSPLHQATNDCLSARCFYLFSGVERGLLFGYADGLLGASIVQDANTPQGRFVYHVAMGAA